MSEVTENLRKQKNERSLIFEQNMPDINQIEIIVKIILAFFLWFLVFWKIRKKDSHFEENYVSKSMS